MTSKDLCKNVSISVETGLATIDAETFLEIKKYLEKLEYYETIFKEPLIEIRKRLEILDMLKQEFHIELYSAEEISYHAYLITIQSCEDYEHGSFDTTAETTITKEQYDKLKEWLEEE